MFSWTHFLTYAVITAMTPGPITSCPCPMPGVWASKGRFRSIWASGSAFRR